MSRPPSPPAGGHAGFWRPLAALAILALSAAFAIGGAGCAAAAEGDACLLVNGRLVGAAEISDVAKSWDAPVARYAGAEAGRIVAALGSPYLPDDVEGAALVAFAAEGKERIFLMQGGCVRAVTIVAPDARDAALRAALGAPA